jgi:hypothetical protein
MRPVRYVIPQAVVDRTSEYLRISLREEIEVVVFWSGFVHGQTRRMAHVWLPKQYSGAGLFMVPGDELFALNKEIYELGERLLAQVHTHPTLAFHSSTDSEFAVTDMEGGLSIVVPEFGRVGVDSIEQCAFFVFESGGWRQLSKSEAAQRVSFGSGQ